MNNFRWRVAFARHRRTGGTGTADGASSDVRLGVPVSGRRVRTRDVVTPATIRRRLDTMARTGRRIHISEVTIPQSEKGARGLAVQATAIG